MIIFRLNHPRMDPGQSRSIEAAVTTSSLGFRKTQIPRPHHQWQIQTLGMYLKIAIRWSYGSFDWSCLLDHLFKGSPLMFASVSVPFWLSHYSWFVGFLGYVDSIFAAYTTSFPPSLSHPTLILHVMWVPCHLFVGQAPLILLVINPPATLR